MPTVRATLEATVPAGWFYKEQLSLMSPGGQSNVIVTVEPLDPTLGATTYAAIQGELLAREFPKYREHSFEPCVAFGRLPGFIREFSWTPPDGVPITQLQVYAVEGARGFTGTATAPATVYAAQAEVLRHVLLSAWTS